MHVAEASGDLCQQAIAKMRSPFEMAIICIDITNKCDLACSNCTRLLENQEQFWDMSLDNFRTALRSLEGFPGTIAVIGGNPAMHRHFPEICKIMTQEVPEKKQRGLWTNNIFKHGAIAKETFGVFNLNPHGDARGVKSITEFMKGIRKPWYHGGHSHHAPILTAGKDIYGEEEMWERIAKCDVNQNWSASIVENKGQLRAYFCEVAASFDLARNEDHGVEVVPGWWRRNVREFEPQVRRFCPGCGVPAKLKGHMDHEETDTYSATNADIALKSLKKKRKIVEMAPGTQPGVIEHKVVHYSENLREGRAGRPKVVTLLDRIKRTMTGRS
ncbi:MAG: hypothetical protein GC199_00655 [Alphaproteobacteria bacterium]|nr:hypothetical protein [Alphaproteobacteria bacterium]